MLSALVPALVPGEVSERRARATHEAEPGAVGVALELPRTDPVRVAEELAYDEPRAAEGTLTPAAARMSATASNVRSPHIIFIERLNLRNVRPPVRLAIRDRPHPPAGNHWSARCERPGTGGRN
jgi:hypothetical protein